MHSSPRPLKQAQAHDLIYENDLNLVAFSDMQFDNQTFGLEFVALYCVFCYTTSCLSYRA